MGDKIKDIICLYTETCPVYRNWIKNAVPEVKHCIDIIYRIPAEYRCLALDFAKKGKGNIGAYLKKKMTAMHTHSDAVIVCPQIETLNQLERILSGKEK